MTYPKSYAIKNREINWTVCTCGKGMSKSGATEEQCKLWWKLHSKRCDAAKKLGKPTFRLGDFPMKKAEEDHALFISKQLTKEHELSGFTYF